MAGMTGAPMCAVRSVFFATILGVSIPAIAMALAPFEPSMVLIEGGTGYSIQTLRDGRTDDKIFGTPDAAKAEILRREPVSVA